MGEGVSQRCGCLEVSGLIASPVDLIPDILPAVVWTDDVGYALLALVYSGPPWQVGALADDPSEREIHGDR